MYQHKQAFTLIELLVVVLIIGILAAVAVPQYQKAVMRSRYTELKVLTKAIADAQEVYFLANGQYTQNLADLDIDIGGISVTSKQRKFGWGYCDAESADIYCYNEKIKMGFQKYFQHASTSMGKSYCSALGNDLTTLQHQLCKSETGASAPIGSTEGLRFWRY